MSYCIHAVEFSSCGVTKAVTDIILHGYTITQYAIILCNMLVLGRL